MTSCIKFKLACFNKSSQATYSMGVEGASNGSPPCFQKSAITGPVPIDGLS